MQRIILKSKIHRARITDANLNYVGSLTIDKDLMEAADLVPYEQVHVLNINNGHRLETYVIEGERGSGEIKLNGAAARLGQPGDLIIIVSYVHLDEEETKQFKPRIIHVDENNKIVS